VLALAFFILFPVAVILIATGLALFNGDNNGED
jgi:hypothetical protein